MPTIGPASGARRVVHVRDFGAAGDGVTDDSVRIQAAVDFGGADADIVFGSGDTYALAFGHDTLIAKARQRWIGYGATIVSAAVDDGSGAAIIANEGCDTEDAYAASGGMTFEGLTIEAPFANGILIAHSDGFVVRDCRFGDITHHAVDVIGSRNGLVEGCYSDNANTATDTGSTFQIDRAASGCGAIWKNGSIVSVSLDDTVCDNVTVQDCTIVRNAQAWGMHIHRAGHSNIRFLRNRIRDCVLRGILLDASGGLTDIELSDNWIMDCGRRAIDVFGAFDRLTIARNHVSSAATAYTSDAILVQPQGASTDARVIDNEVADFTLCGIRVSSTNYSVVGFDISGNRVRRGSGGSTGGNRLIMAGDNTSYGTINGNVLDGGMADFGPNLVGIYLNGNGTATAIVVDGNQIRRCNKGIASNKNLRAVRITDNVITENWYRAIDLGSDEEVTAVGCAVNGNTVDTSKYTGILVIGPTACSIMGNALVDIGGTEGASGIQLFGTGTRNIVGLNVVAGGDLDAEEGLLITHTTITDTIVLGNSVSGFAYGLYTSQGWPGAVIAGNIVKDNDDDVQGLGLTLVTAEVGHNIIGDE